MRPTVLAAAVVALSDLVVVLLLQVLVASVVPNLGDALYALNSKRADAMLCSLRSWRARHIEALRPILLNIASVA